MNITTNNNRIIFNDMNNKTLANISFNKNHDCAFLELIKVDQNCRRKRCATKMMYKMLAYLKLHNYIKVSLSPLPLEHNDISLNELITFYKHFGFKISKNINQSSPYLMEKTL